MQKYEKLKDYPCSFLNIGKVKLSVLDKRSSTN